MKDRVAAEVKVPARRGLHPGLATVLVGDDVPAEAYERRASTGSLTISAAVTTANGFPGTWTKPRWWRRSATWTLTRPCRGSLVLRPIATQVSGVAVYRELDP